MATPADQPLSDRLESLVQQTGETLEEGRYPLEITNNPELYRHELKRIFGHAWIYLGHTSEFTEPRDYARRYIGETVVR